MTQMAGTRNYQSIGEVLVAVGAPGDAAFNVLVANASLNATLCAEKERESGTLIPLSNPSDCSTHSGVSSEKRYPPRGAP